MGILINIGCFVLGALFGVVIMCLFVAAGSEDERSGMK